MNIPAILHSHFSSAAWLYTQFEPDRSSALVDIHRLRHYQRLFVAHLDGLRFGGEASVDVAAEQLQRWKGHGELFVCWYLAQELEHPNLMNAAWHFLTAHQQPRYVDAVASALLWLSAEKAAVALERLRTADTPLALQIALNAAGLRRAPCPFDSSLFLHDAFEIRAEACRYAGRLRRFDAVPLLLRTIADDQPTVREQAAVALLLCNEAESALPELFAALQRAVDLVEADEGSASIRAENRAQHLARLLGHALPFPCDTPTMQALAEKLPPFVFLLALAHHGNPAHIDLLSDFMQPNGLYKRRALWAMCFILGINPETKNLLTTTPSLSADWPRAPGLDQDTGLPEPDADAVALWWNIHRSAYPTGQASCLEGTTLCAVDTVLPLLQEGMQGQRFAAALHLCRLSDKAVWLDTRAPVAMQTKTYPALSMTDNTRLPK